jgi:hypothetical protein
VLRRQRFCEVRAYGFPLPIGPRAVGMEPFTELSRMREVRFVVYEDNLIPHPATRGSGVTAASVSAACVGERDEGGKRVTLESQRAPVVPTVAAFPDLAVGEAGEEATVGGDECVGHRRERFW